MLFVGAGWHETACRALVWVVVASPIAAWRFLSVGCCPFSFGGCALPLCSCTLPLGVCALPLWGSGAVGGGAAVGVEACEQVGAVETAQRSHDVGLDVFLIPEEIFALGKFFLFRLSRIHWLERVGVETCVESFGAHRHGCGREILYLFEVEIKFFGDSCQFRHIFLGATWVRRNEVRNDLLLQSVFLVQAVENSLELVEQGERRFAHQVEHFVAGVLWSHFQSARHMEANQFLIVLPIHLVHFLIAGFVHGEVVAHTAADKRLFHLRHCIYGVVDVEQGTVVGVQIAAWLRVQTRWASAALASLQVFAVHTIHVGARSAQVADISLEIVHRHHLFHLAHNALLASRRDEFALMRADGAKCAATEATTVHIH